MKNKKLRLNAEIRKGISQQFRNHLDNENRKRERHFYNQENNIQMQKKMPLV